MRSSVRQTLAFFAILFGYCIYAACFIYRTSFVIDGQRYFALFDDAMISMRYARNLAHGYGLVWNPGGARVEGYTNPLWTLYMALLHLLPIDPSKMSLSVQVTGALLLAVNLFFVKRIADALGGGSEMVTLSAVFLTAFYLPLNNWGLQGTEVSALTVALSAAVLEAIRAVRSGRISRRLYLLMGIATLVRPDMIVPFLAIWCFMVWADPSNRRRHVLWGLSSLAFFVALQTGFRLIYYGSPLPNTYYLKMTGYPAAWRIARGLDVFAQFVWNFNWLVFLIPFVTLLIRRDRTVLLLAWVFLGQVAYSVYVGGDAWEAWGGSNRYVSVAMPIWFIWFSLSLREIGLLLLDRLRAQTWFRPRYSVYATVIVVLLTFCSVNSLDGTANLARWSLIERPLEVEWGAQRVKLGLLIKRFTDPKATIAVFAAGDIPYFSDRAAIDLLGKSDVRVAHEQVPIPPGVSLFTYFHPGHLKRDYAYSIGQLKPDLLGEPLLFEDEAKPDLAGDYVEVPYAGYELWCRKGSTHILWSKLPSSAE